jgi:hypothetical protein
MRLWSIHPAYLDAKGLVALWREGLLAQKVLLGNTRGYKHHPQLTRFRDSANPLGAIASYLRVVVAEAEKRQYKFDGSRIVNKRFLRKIPVTRGQVEYEFRHLLSKLYDRDPDLYRQLKSAKRIRLHPLFIKIEGAVEPWEIV